MYCKYLTYTEGFLSVKLVNWSERGTVGSDRASGDAVSEYAIFEPSLAKF
jgi:hypothetical protein